MTVKLNYCMVVKEPPTELDSLTVLQGGDGERENPRESKICTPILTPCNVALLGYVTGMFFKAYFLWIGNTSRIKSTERCMEVPVH